MNMEKVRSSVTQSSDPNWSIGYKYNGLFSEAAGEGSCTDNCSNTKQGWLTHACIYVSVWRHTLKQVRV